MFSNGVEREFSWLVISLTLLMLFCLVTDLWFFGFAVFLALYIARMLWSMHRFEKWMDKNQKGAMPPVSGFWSEITYLVSKKQRGLESHADLQLYKSEQFKAASMQIPDAIVSLNNKNQIEWFNASSKEILQLRTQDIGRPIERLLRFPEFISFIKSSDYSGSINSNSLPNPQRIYNLKIIPYFDVHKLLIIKDITDLYHLAQVRRDFIANASHELRTPLTVLKGYLEAMVDTPGPHQDMWSQALNNMDDQAERMQAIIVDLLSLSKIESEDFSQDEEVVDVPNMLEKLVVDAKQLSQKQHTFEVEIDNHLCLYGHIEPLKSVFTNLITNAVRYTPKGGQIIVSWKQDKDEAVFSVKDTGIGISPEHIPRLTERFYRVDTARSRMTGGTGLGLAIVKHILERYHSVLEVESQIGQGSEFSCRFSVNHQVDCSES